VRGQEVSGGNGALKRQGGEEIWGASRGQDAYDTHDRLEREEFENIPKGKMVCCVWTVVVVPGSLLLLIHSLLTCYPLARAFIPYTLHW
jgi:hypothetical protein